MPWGSFVCIARLFSLCIYIHCGNARPFDVVRLFYLYIWALLCILYGSFRYVMRLQGSFVYIVGLF